MKIKTDILIVGAGPAGCTAAIAADGAQLKTIIIEREKFPRDKICGDAVLLSVFDLLHEKLKLEKNIFFSPPASVKASCVNIYNSGNEKISFDPNFITLRRWDLDTILWNAIPANVQKFPETVVSQITKQNNKYIVKCVTEGVETEIETNFIIGADGYSSYIKRNFFKDLKYEVRTASRCYLKGSDKMEDSFNFYFEEELAPGYFWCFKVSEGMYNTGVYLPEGSKLDLYEAHKHYANKYFGSVIEKKDFHTWPIPNNCDFSVLAKENVLLAGDAAGLCDKLFGHGIDTAIISGYVAVKSISYYQSQKDKKYAIGEVYRFNLHQYLDKLLSGSEKACNMLTENKKDVLEVIKNYLEDEMG